MSEIQSTDQKEVMQVLNKMRQALLQIGNAPILEIHGMKARWMQKIAKGALSDCQKILFPEVKAPVKSLIEVQ